MLLLRQAQEIYELEDDGTIEGEFDILAKTLTTCLHTLCHMPLATISLSVEDVLTAIAVTIWICQ